MDRKIIAAYLALKAIRSNKELGETYALPLGEKRDLAIAEIMMLPSSVIGPKGMETITRRLANKTNQKANKDVWKDFCGKISLGTVADFYAGKINALLTLRRVEILDYFSKYSGVSKENLIKSKISSSLVMRPLLIDMVEAMEYLTGRQLTADCGQPLQYLDEEATFGDIADYFSTTGSVKINRIRTKIFQPKEKSLEDELNIFRAYVLAVYAGIIGQPVNDALLELKVRECYPQDFGGPENWDLAVAWTEDEVGVLVYHLLNDDPKRNFIGEITRDSTVADLVNIFCREKKKALEKKRA